MTKEEFVFNLFDTCSDIPTTMTLEDAENDLRNFRAEEWDVPDDLSAEEYAELWNGMVSRQARLEEMLQDI